MITLDFMFSLVLSISFAMIFFVVSFSLALVEAAQYVTFTTSRAYSAAHESMDFQQQLAQQRFTEVMALPTIKTLLGQQWFKLGQPELGDFSSEYPEEEDKSAAAGARITMDARLLHLRLPFLGNTAEDANVGKATLNSYLLREVSSTECRESFNRARYNQIKTIKDAPYGATPGSDAFLITDNGC